jgi:hypothetical protein
MLRIALTWQLQEDSSPGEQQHVYVALQLKLAYQQEFSAMLQTFCPSLVPLRSKIALYR